MNKSLLALAVTAASSLAISSHASADTILGIYAGGGTWQASYSGKAGTDAVDFDQLNLDDSDNTFFYLALEHPVPLIPNIRLAHTSVRVDGNAVLESSFTLDEQTFDVNAEVYTDFDLTHTDATLYYELLDNWVSFDLGLTARLFDGYAYAVDQNDPTNPDEVELSEVIPMGYGKLQFDLPLTGWHLATSVNYIGYEGDSFSDVDAKFGYMSDGFVLDFGLDVGYRRMNLDISDSGDLEADVTIDGPYLEISAHF